MGVTEGSAYESQTEEFYYEGSTYESYDENTEKIIQYGINEGSISTKGSENLDESYDERAALKLDDETEIEGSTKGSRTEESYDTEGSTGVSETMESYDENAEPKIEDEKGIVGSTYAEDVTEPTGADGKLLMVPGNVKGEPLYEENEASLGEEHPNGEQDAEEINEVTVGGGDQPIEESIIEIADYAKLSASDSDEDLETTYTLAATGESFIGRDSVDDNSRFNENQEVFEVTELVTFFTEIEDHSDTSEATMIVSGAEGTMTPIEESFSGEEKKLYVDEIQDDINDLGKGSGKQMLPFGDEEALNVRIPPTAVSNDQVTEPFVANIEKISDINEAIKNQEVYEVSDHSAMISNEEIPLSTESIKKNQNIDIDGSDDIENNNHEQITTDRMIKSEWPGESNGPIEGNQGDDLEARTEIGEAPDIFVDDIVGIESPYDELYPHAVEEIEKFGDVGSLKNKRIFKDMDTNYPLSGEIVDEYDENKITSSNWLQNAQMDASYDFCYPCKECGEKESICRSIGLVHDCRNIANCYVSFLADKQQCCVKIKCAAEKKPSKQIHKESMHALVKDMKYIFDGEFSLNIEDTQCNQGLICQSLEAQSKCRKDQFSCSTLTSCTGDQCICYVSSKCNNKDGGGGNSLQSLLSTGATCLDMQPGQKDQCQQICPSLTQHDWVCKGSKPSSCHTEYSCKETCKCWINVQCPTSGSKMRRRRVKVAAPQIAAAGKLALETSQDKEESYIDELMQVGLQLGPLGR